VVGFDRMPVKFIFWRGTGDIPMIANENDQWYSNEFNETWGRSGGQGCQEPMSDKESFFNHVRVIENTPARVVVQWRFPLVDVHHVIANWNPATGWGDWSDWYYYIYPDGVAVKKMHLWTNGLRNHEWQESMAVLGPNQHPEQVLETDPALFLADLDGNVTQYSWTHGPPRGVDYRNRKIHVVNYRAVYDPFTIGDFLGGNVYGGGAVPYSVFPSWNHWPVAQIPSDGRYALFPDRAAHCSLTHVFMPDYSEDYGDRPFQEKLLMEGMSNLGAKGLAPLAKSWLRAPALENLSDCRGPGFDPSQRAFVVSATGVSPSFRIAASPERPLVNPCFVVRNWNDAALAQVQVDSKVEAAGAGLRQGIVRDPNGRASLVVWLEHQAAAPTTFTFRGARPDGSVLQNKEIAWATSPRLDSSSAFTVIMSATPLSDVGVEYFFECTKGPGHSSDWQSAPVYGDSGLAPRTAFSYRVKARDFYFAETEWSPAEQVTTDSAPEPAVWSMEEGDGEEIRDGAGGHVGVIHGIVTRAPGVAGKALHLEGDGYLQVTGADDLSSSGAFTWTAWIRTTRGGTILARSGAGREWQRGGKVLFVADGRLRFDAAWVGPAGGETPVADGRWHHVAVTVSGPGASSGDNVHCFVDGRRSGGARLDVGQYDESGLPVRIGFCNDDFPRGPSGFVGDLDQVCWFGYALGPEQVQQLFRDKQ